MHSLEKANDFIIESIYAAGVFQNERTTEILSGFSDRVEAVFVNSGKLVVTCGHQSYVCNSGTAALFKPGEARCIKFLKEEYTEYLAVSFSVSSECSFEFSNKITSLTVLQKQLVQSVCSTIFAEGEYNTVLPTVFTKDSLQALRLAATLKLLTVDVSFNKNNLQPQAARDAVLFKNAIDEMQESVLGQLSLEDLAHKLDISLSHLKRIFANFSDVGVHEYFMAIKIEKAKEMLKTGVSVTETAERTGFNNQNYFSAAFKRIVGVSPKEYCTVKKKKAPQKVAVTSVKNNFVPEKKSVSDMPSYLL